MDAFVDEYLAGLSTGDGKPVNEDSGQAAEDAANNLDMKSPAQASATGSAAPTNEETTVAAVAGYDTARAFSRPGQKSHRGIEQSRREGWQLVSEDDGAPSLIVCSGSMAPQQLQDPQSPKPATPVNEGANWKLRKLVEHLQDVLPLDEENVWADDAGNVNVETGDLRIMIIPKGASLFDVETMVGARRLPRKTALPYGAMLSFVFDACGVEDVTDQIVGGIGTEKSTEPQTGYTEDAESANGSDVFEVLKELAGASGQPTDIFRNKNLFDLRGLAAPKAITKQPFVTLRQQLAEKFDPKPEATKGPLTDQTVPRNLRAQNVKNGAPVSLNESRDVTRPYSNTLGGKRIVMHPTKGAILVDRDALPEGKKLSWDAKAGAVMVNESQQTKRPNWKPYWMQDR